MTHDCIKRVNDLLLSNNTQISQAISFSSPERELIQIATCKVDTTKRGKPLNFFASHCPFCGVKLNEDVQA